MFYRARLKLTFWYVLIILSISSIFSLIIYSRISEDLARANRIFIRREIDSHIRLPFVETPPEINNKFFEQALDRLRLTLALINLGIVLVSAGAGFFLAGQTLQPIQDMVDDQQRFIADASHELRTPLTALRTQLEVTLRDSKRTPAETTAILKSNLEEVVALQNLTNNLLDLVHNTNNPKANENLSLFDLLNSLVVRFEPVAEEKHIHIESYINSHEQIFANSQEIRQLISIILDNAIKYSPKNSLITVKLDDVGKNIELKIIDQGVGIDPSDLPYIFDRFYRAEKSRTKSEVVGYGLGLAIAKKIADNHQAKIAISSKPGIGTTVTLSFKRNRKLSR